MTTPARQKLSAPVLLFSATLGAVALGLGYVALSGVQVPAIGFSAAPSAQQDESAASSGHAGIAGPGAAQDAADTSREDERDEELAIQRRMAEMPPDTPGVTPDQYVGEGDDSSYAKDDEDQ